MKKVFLLFIALQLIASIVFSTAISKEVGIESASVTKQLSLTEVLDHHDSWPIGHAAEDNTGHSFCDHCLSCQPTLLNSEFAFPKILYTFFTITFYFSHSSYSALPSEIFQPPKKLA